MCGFCKATGQYEAKMKFSGKFRKKIEEDYHANQAFFARYSKSCEEEVKN